MEKKNEEEDKVEEHQEEQNKDYVSLTKEQFETIKIKLGTIEKKNLSSMVKANGVLDLPPQNKASVSSLIGGVINKINVIQGDFVKKGQVLATIEHPDILKVQQDYLEAKSNFIYAEKEFQRQKELYDEKIVAGKKFQAAEADYRSQRSLLTSLENQLSQIGISPSSINQGKMIRSIPITSPIHGFVNTVNVNTGSYVEPAKEIFMVIDNHHIHIDLQVFEQDVAKVKEGQKVFFTLSNAPGQQYEATIFAVGKAFETHTKSVSVHADIKGNKSHELLPGMYVDGRIQVNDSTTTALPNEAVFSEGNLKYIFAKVDSIPEVHHDEDSEKKEDEHEEAVPAYSFRKVPVQTGVSDLGYTQVALMEKLSPDTEIVVKGTFFLAAQMKKGEGGEGHGH